MCDAPLRFHCYKRALTQVRRHKLKARNKVSGSLLTGRPVRVPRTSTVLRISKPVPEPLSGKIALFSRIFTSSSSSSIISYQNPCSASLSHRRRNIGQAIQRDLIVRCWDDMHRISASLKDGTMTAVLLVAKLQALDNKNLIHRGLEQYGRLLKTIDILTFLSDKPYRRRIGRMLNKRELVHSLARLVAFGQLGVLTDRDLATAYHLSQIFVSMLSERHDRNLEWHGQAKHSGILEIVQDAAPAGGPGTSPSCSSILKRSK
jgi:Tn3 transposase DDE domain